jgi:hypothetical protein
LSQVYRVGKRFVEAGISGLVDRREENGSPKVTEDYVAELLTGNCLPHAGREEEWGGAAA